MDAGNYYEAAGGEDVAGMEEPLFCAPPPEASSEKEVPKDLQISIGYHPQNNYWVAWNPAEPVASVASGRDPKEALSRLLTKILG